MYHSITFYNGTEKFNTYDDLFLVPEKRPLFAAPVPKTKYVDIPGADGQIDLTESLTGHPVFNNREGSWTFYVLNDHGEWIDRYSEIMAKIQGRLLKAVLEDEPEYYYQGRFYLSEWSNEPSYSKVTINYKAEPYKRSFQEDNIQIGTWGPTVIDSGDVVSFDYPNDHGTFKALSAAITPTQSLNGYTKPWPGDGGANKLNLDSPNICRECTKKDSAAGSVTLNVNNSYYATINLSGNNLPQEMVDRILNGEPITFEVDNNGGKTISIVVYGQRSDGTTYQEVSSVASNIVTITTEKFTSVSRVEFRFWRAAAQYTDTTTVVTGLRISYGSTATAFTPYSNICPITGQTSVSVYHAGDGLLPFPSTENGWKPGYYSNSGTIMPQSSINLEMYNEEYIAIPEGTTQFIFTVHFSSEPPIDTMKYWKCLCFYDENKEFIVRIPVTNPETYVFTVPANAAFCRASCRTYGIAEFLNLEYGTGNKITVQLGQTVYGGAIDVVSGTLTLTHRTLTIDGNTSSLSVGTNTTTGLYYCASSPISEADAGINTSSGGGLLCDRFNVNTRIAIGNTYLTGYGKTLVFVLPDQTIDTVAKARVWLTENPVTWVYELAEPKTVQLTGQALNTLMGQNNVWASTGEIEAEWGDNPGVIYNPTQFSVRPIIKVTNPTAGATVSLNGVTMTCSEAYQGEVTIDCDRMNVYSGNTNLNSKWSKKFPELKGGNNNASFSGCDSMKVVVNWRAL